MFQVGAHQAMGFYFASDALLDRTVPTSNGIVCVALHISLPTRHMSTKLMTNGILFC